MAPSSTLGTNAYQNSERRYPGRAASHSSAAARPNTAPSVEWGKPNPLPLLAGVVSSESSASRTPVASSCPAGPTIRAINTHYGTASTVSMDLDNALSP